MAIAQPIRFSTAGRNKQVWAPQVIINGRANIVGSHRAPLLALIAQTDRGTAGPAVTLTIYAVAITGVTAKPADIWLVRYEPHAIEVAVKAGKNGDKTLPHRNIGCELIKIGRWTGDNNSFTIPGATRPGLAAAAFVQTGTGGPIIAAARG